METNGKKYDLVEKKRTRIKPPQMQTISSRKCMWVNFQEICSMMQRDPQHVYQFFMTELGTEGSIDGNQRLIIRKYNKTFVSLAYGNAHFAPFVSHTHALLSFPLFIQTKVVATCPNISRVCCENML